MKYPIPMPALVLVFFIWWPALFGQKGGTPYQRGVQLQEEFRYREALDIFRPLLKADSTNVDLLSRVSYLMAYPVYPELNAARREQTYRDAAYLAAKAIRLQPGHAHAHYSRALALGRISTSSNIKDRVEYARQIRSECEKAIQLDSDMPGPYHILARWHREVAGMNMLEKAMVLTFFSGKLEDASFEDAIRNFKHALKLDPLNPVHYYEIAVTYQTRGDKLDTYNAKNWLHKTLKVRVRNDFDRQVHAKAQKLLKKLGG